MLVGVDDDVCEELMHPLLCVPGSGLYMCEDAAPDAFEHVSKAGRLMRRDALYGGSDMFICICFAPVLRHDGRLV